MAVNDKLQYQVHATRAGAQAPQHALLRHYLSASVTALRTSGALT